MMKCERCDGNGYTVEITPHAIFGDQVDRPECGHCNGTGIVDAESHPPLPAVLTPFPGAW